MMAVFCSLSVSARSDLVSRSWIQVSIDIHSVLTTRKKYISTTKPSPLYHHLHGSQDSEDCCTESLQGSERVLTRVRRL
jgi:hypothetical protein